VFIDESGSLLAPVVRRSWAPRGYDLERDHRFDFLKDRLIIDWGPAPRQWVQNPSNKPLLSILESGRVLPPFEDYLEFS